MGLLPIRYAATYLSTNDLEAQHRLRLMLNDTKKREELSTILLIGSASLKRHRAGGLC